ncbi:MAG: sel1 repeat family protein [Deltaproteobacteria bacterium]|jgi:TPR repeat protein|nr:sel1 repeat family protein [Deltaproteobacteria bacterium]
MFHTIDTGVLEESEAPISFFQSSAEKGDPPSQFCLGIKYYLGDEVPRDRDKALCWLLAAAGSDLAEAHFCLGRIYEKARDIRCPSKSQHWYRLAARKGLLVNEDEATGFTWLTNRDHLRAQELSYALKQLDRVHRKVQH